MATFDVDGFRKAAEAAGIPKDQIENEIKFQTSAPAKTDPFEKDEGGFKLGSVEQVSERLGNDWWHLPAGLAAIGAGIYGASRLMGGGPNTPPNNPPGPRIDPTFDVQPIAQQPLEPVKPSLPQQTNLTPQDLEARAAQLKAPAAPVGAIPPAPEMPVSTPITAAPIEAPAPTPSAQPNSPVTSIVTDTVKEMIQETPAQPTDITKPVAAPVAAPQPVAPPQDLVTGTGKPAFAGMGPEAAVNKKGQPKFKSEYADINAVPRGYAFVPGADKIDTLRNTLGQQAYTEAFKNLPFPSTNEMAIQQASEINRMLGRPTRDELIAAGKTPAANTPGITQPTNPPKGSGLGTKTAKVGGVLGALIAIPDLAKADTPGQRGMAAANLLEAVLPPGFMMSSAGEGSTLSPEQIQQQMQYRNNMMLLGSPYAQSPLAVKQRQEQEYVRKVGAGRGIAPPSAYQR
jgi:hypothetical protein